MHEEAEKWIEKMCGLALTADGDLDEDLSQLLREAMRWAYADAARVIEGLAEKHEGPGPYVISWKSGEADEMRRMAKAILARADDQQLGGPSATR